MFSEDIEGDADYLKMVQDIEDLQQQQGWLFGRGAFDKGDLLYLRDEAEKQRHAELELRDTELSQFAALKARMETKDKRRKETATSLPKSKSAKRSQTRILGTLLRVKPKAKLEIQTKRKSAETAESRSKKVKDEKPGVDHQQLSDRDTHVQDAKTS